jgi:multisubunit Na+/H+ antiporter MnhE subunit
MGGRNVPNRAVVLAGALGAAALTLLWTWVALQFALGQRIDGRDLSTVAPLNVHDWRGVLAVTLYAPLLLWGPLLAAVTVAYHRRRRSPSARPIF